MPKTKPIESVVKDWVSELSFQQQALLFTAMRGPDNLPKHNAAKCIVRYLRGIVLKRAKGHSNDNDNDFMWNDYSKFSSYIYDFIDNHDEYPHHFIMHLIHCAELVGYTYPDKNIADQWKIFYLKMCDAFHMYAEGPTQMNNRLNDFK